METHDDRGKEDRLLPDKMSKEDPLGQMATAYIKPDCTGDGRNN